MKKLIILLICIAGCTGTDVPQQSVSSQVKDSEHKSLKFIYFTGISDARRFRTPLYVDPVHIVSIGTSKCGPPESFTSLTLSTGHTHCVEGSIKEALRKIDN